MNSQKYSNLMHINVLIFIHLLCFTNGDEITDLSDSIPINNISDSVLSLIEFNDTEKIIELKDKLANVSRFVIDNEKVNQLLMNVTKETNLNETEFYKSLQEEDHFRLLTQNEPKNLYLQLKQKVNRDDILDMLAKRNKTGTVVKSARKAMVDEYYGKRDKEILNDVVDKMIAEAPKDEHKFRANINDSKYWDPQKELEDLRDFHKHDGRRIFKGERTTVRYYPFMVSIHVMGRFWCGGVIYWHDLVLTSAACLQLMHNNRFFRENPKVLQVRVGSNHSRIGGEMIDALEVYFHPGYSPRTLQNNIAIIRLRRHLHFDYHLVPKIIDISHNSDGMAMTAEVLLLGWGVTKISQKMSYEPVFLQKKFLPIYPNRFCKEVYGDKYITSTMFCAGTMSTGEGACDHDAGGPAILSGKLVGIISFGPTVCGFPNAPTVFTLIGAFADWIETINETMPNYYRAKKRTTTTTPSPLLDLLDNWPYGHYTQGHTMNEMHFTPVQTTDAKNALVEMPTLAPGELVMRGEDSEDGWSIDEKN